MDCLFGLVGWRQNVNPDYASLVPSLVASSTGLYFQDEHPLVTIENLDQALKNYDHFIYPAWSGVTTYAIRARVVKGGKNWESLLGVNLNHDPEEVASIWWTEISLLNEKLTHITRAAINKVASKVFTDKKLNGVTKAIFENVQLFDGAGSMQNKELGLSRFVGFEINLNSHRDLVVILRRLGTQFSQVNPAFDLYLFHSSQETPLKKFTQVLTKANSFEWSRLLDNGEDFVLKFLTDSYAPGGSFYLGYYEDALVGQAINRGYDFANAPDCTTCGNNYNFYTQWSRYMDISPIEVAAPYLAGILPGDPGGPKLWDIRKNSYQWTKNFGLNLDLSVRCDVTDFFCREKTIFSDAIIKQVAVDSLGFIAYSTRNTPISKETRDLAMFELGNRDNNTPGLATRLEKALKAVSLDMSGLDESCLPCDDRDNGPVYKTI